MREYINKDRDQLKAELVELINKYNKLRDTYLLIYAAPVEKDVPGIELNESDYYTMFDLLSNVTTAKKLDVYIETPGGRGETVDEIVKLLRGKFDEVYFVVSGEAKSAGTIFALSGNDIFMTETGSLGPIDAQVRVGRTVQSASDYIEWVKKKKRDLNTPGGYLDDFDGQMTAQITPGELKDICNILKFAEDLVVEWLPKYKFKDWNVTETRHLAVTPQRKKDRALEIANALVDHSRWRFHGRSIKRKDLEDIGLKIKKVEDDPEFADLVFRIQTVCRLMFETTFAYKIIASKDDAFIKTAVPMENYEPFSIYEVPVTDAALLQPRCYKCGNTFKLYAKLAPNPDIDGYFAGKKISSFPKNNKIKCDCGSEIDLSWFRTKIETETGLKIISS